MKLDVIKLDGGKAGSIDLDEALFGLEPRADILHRVVRWQRAKAQAGTHSTLARAERQLFDQEDLSPERHRRRTPRVQEGTDLPSRRRLQGPDSRAATRMTCPRSSGRSVCVTRCRPRPRRVS